MVSFTITEKGYAVKNSGGAVMPYIQADIDNAPEKAKSLMGLMAYLAYVRFLAGKLPLSFVSMDNCSHNGEKLQSALTYIAEAWRGKGAVEAGFCDYLNDSGAVAFPWSMIDKITPRPSEIVREALVKLGCENMDIVKTSKETYAAPFVNAEHTQYLVIEDAFPNGRPPLEKAGVLFTDRETVNKVEKMKVGACLNPLHTILAVFGCTLGYRFIYEEMQYEPLVNLIKKAGYQEALPYVPDPGVIRPRDFIDEVIGERFANPFIPDTPQRIASDTSQKIPIRFGEVLNRMIAEGFDVTSLEAFPFFFAGWLRYLLCVDDCGEPFEASPDPMLNELRAVLAGIHPGDKGPFTEHLKPILSDSAIFGVDLYACGLAAKTEAYFTEMAAGPGAVAKTLEKYFS